MDTVFALLTFVSLIFTILSIFIPNKTAFFARQPISQARLKVPCFYLVLTCIFFVGLVAAIPKPISQEVAVTTTTQETITVSQQELVTPAAPIVAEPETIPDKKPSAPSQNAPASVASTQSTSKSIPDTVAQKQEFIKLYNELQTFRNSKKFHTVGFAQKPYSDWMDRVNAADERYKGLTQVQTELIFGELRMVALAYQRGKGYNHDNIAQDMEEKMKKIMSQKP